MTKRVEVVIPDSMDSDVPQQAVNRVANYGMERKGLVPAVLGGGLGLLRRAGEIAIGSVFQVVPEGKAAVIIKREWPSLDNEYLLGKGTKRRRIEEIDIRNRPKPGGFVLKTPILEQVEYIDIVTAFPIGGQSQVRPESEGLGANIVITVRARGQVMNPPLVRKQFGGVQEAIAVASSDSLNTAVSYAFRDPTLYDDIAEAKRESETAGEASPIPRISGVAAAKVDGWYNNLAPLTAGTVLVPNLTSVEVKVNPDTEAVIQAGVQAKRTETIGGADAYVLGKKVNAILSNVPDNFVELLAQFFGGRRGGGGITTISP